MKDSALQLLSSPRTIQNEWVACNRILVFAQRFAGSPRDKYFNSLYIKKCVAKGFFDVQKNHLERDYRSFVAVLSEMDLGNVDTREA